MVSNAIQKQISKQSLHKVSSKAATRKCRFLKKGVLKNFSQVFSCEYCKIFKNSIFIENLWWLLFQFHEVTVQHWASADLLFLIKNTMWDSFYEKGL